jgi:lipid II:glycine glycyltransferase (peptidoglycan interpeptide bridge formation enzyme)
MQTFLARSDGEVIGALVCSLMGDNAIYLLGATNERARELKAAYFLQWQAMLWLKERGARSYDLGGIDPAANPGGHHFKSGFGGEPVSQLAAYGHRGNMLSSGVAAFAAWRQRRRRL